MSEQDRQVRKVVKTLSSRTSGDTLRVGFSPATEVLVQLIDAAQREASEGADGDAAADPRQAESWLWQAPLTEEDKRFWETEANVTNSVTTEVDGRKMAPKVRQQYDACLKGRGSMCQLGHYYMAGDGVARDYARAAYWYRKAMRGDNPYWGAVKLAELHAKGWGVPKSEETAFRLYVVALKRERSAEAFGIEQVARCYEKGRGVEKDVDKAVRLYRLVATLPDRFGSQRRAKQRLDALAKESPAPGK